MKPAMRSDLPDVLGRHLAVDENGVGLRATWRPAHGFVNMSLWRDDRCVETFHLEPEELSALVSFLVAGLAATAPAPQPPLRVVRDEPGSTAVVYRGPGVVGRAMTALRGGLADLLEDAARWIRPESDDERSRLLTPSPAKADAAERILT